jgi:tripeptide aminopeptidase
MIEAGITPHIVPIRGGTDGARLSYMGLPCPNIFAGGHNFHGKMEFVPLESMVKATEVIIRIIRKYSDNN